MKQVKDTVIGITLIIIGFTFSLLISFGVIEIYDKLINLMK